MDPEDVVRSEARGMRRSAQGIDFGNIEVPQLTAEELERESRPPTDAEAIAMGMELPIGHRTIIQDPRIEEVYQRRVAQHILEQEAQKWKDIGREPPVALLQQLETLNRPYSFQQGSPEAEVGSSQRAPMFSPRQMEEMGRYVQQASPAPTPPRQEGFYAPETERLANMGLQGRLHPTAERLFPPVPMEQRVPPRDTPFRDDWPSDTRPPSSFRDSWPTMARNPDAPRQPASERTNFILRTTEQMRNAEASGNLAEADRLRRVMEDPTRVDAPPNVQRMFGPQPDNSLEAGNVFDLGRRAQEAGDFEAAARYYRRAAELQPPPAGTEHGIQQIEARAREARAHRQFAAGQRAMSNGNYGEAVRLFSEANSLVPHEVTARAIQQAQERLQGTK